MDSRNHEAPNPLLSCHTLREFRGPRTKGMLKTKMSVWLRSNLLSFVRDWERWSSYVEFSSPNNVRKTLASVPAPRKSPVFTVIL